MRSRAKTVPYPPARQNPRFELSAPYPSVSRWHFHLWRSPSSAPSALRVSRKILYFKVYCQLISLQSVLRNWRNQIPFLPFQAELKTTGLNFFQTPASAANAVSFFRVLAITGFSVSSTPVSKDGERRPTESGKTLWSYLYSAATRSPSTGSKTAYLYLRRTITYRQHSQPQP